MIRALVLGSLLLLSACGSSEPAPTLYRLQPAEFQAETVRKGALSVREPVAAPGLDTARIVAIGADGTQTFYEGVRWSANAPMLLQHYLANSLEYAGAFSPVMTDETAANPTWLLEIRLQDFEIDHRRGSQLVIRMSAILIDARTHYAVRTIPLSATRNVAGLSMGGIVQAFNEELDGLSAQLAQELSAQHR